MRFQKVFPTLILSVAAFGLNSCVGGGGESAATGNVDLDPQSPPPTESQVVRDFACFDRGNESEVELSWVDNITDETGFTIQRETQQGADWVAPSEIRALANDEFVTDAPGPGTFRYRIAASTQPNQTEWSPWVVVTVTDGWTQFTPSADTRIVYVSSSLGNDSNNGLSEAAPKQSIEAGYALLRNNSADWLLLRRGDAWSSLTTINWDRNGRSATERILVGSYGPLTLDRPLVLPGDRSFLYHNPGGNPLFSHVAVVGIHVRGQGSRGGIEILGAGTDFLIEDCMFELCGTGIIVQGDDVNGYDGMTIRRNIIIDSYNASGNAHSQGLYASRIQNLHIEENVFDLNGYREGISEPTIFNHNIYLQPLCTNARVNRNIISRASSHGAQMRGGGTCENNLYVRNSLAMFVSINPSVVRYNVVLDGKDISPSLRRGYGIATLQVNPATISYNIVANKPSSVGTGHAFEAAYEPSFNGTPHVATFENNIQYNWPGSSFAVSNSVNGNYTSIRVRNNFFHLPSGVLVSHAPTPFDAMRFEYDGNHYDTQSGTWRIGSTNYDFNAWRNATGEFNAVSGPQSFPDPNRSVASYNASLGGAATFEAFIAECRRQRKGFWRTEFTAPAINQYIRNGFAMEGPQ